MHKYINMKKGELLSRGPQRGCNLVRMACNPSVIFIICNLDFVDTNP